MGDSFITVVLILITAVLLFVVPISAVSARNDRTSEQTVQTAVTNFVDAIRETGMIKQDDYNKLIQEIESTGNKYDTNISVLYIDENPAKKTDSDVSDDIKIGENIYYIEYTKQIEDEFEDKGGIIRLQEGDYIKIDVENTNETMYQMIQKSLYSLSDGNIGRISGEHTSLVVQSTEGKFVKIVEEGE